MQKVETVEVRGIDPRTSRMLSERSTIWATPPDINFALEVSTQESNLGRKPPEQELGSALQLPGASAIAASHTLIGSRALRTY